MPMCDWCNGLGATIGYGGMLCRECRILKYETDREARLLREFQVRA